MNNKTIVIIGAGVSGLSAGINALQQGFHTIILEKNPSEMIIMSVKEEADAKSSIISFEESLKTYLDKPVYSHLAQQFII